MNEQFEIEARRALDKMDRNDLYDTLMGVMVLMFAEADNENERGIQSEIFAEAQAGKALEVRILTLKIMSEYVRIRLKRARERANG